MSSRIKKLLFVLLLLSSSAFADIDSEVIARTPNKNGGEIVFTTRPGNCNNGMRMVYATSVENTLIWGCWFSTDGFIFVQWLSGEQTSYDISTLKFSDWFIKEVNKSQVKKSV